MIVRPDLVPIEQVLMDRIMTIGLNERREVGRVGGRKIIVIHLQRLLINAIRIIISRRQKRREEELIEDLME